MEQLDPDYDYVVQARETRPTNPNSRFNVLLLLPILAIVWVLFLLASAIFQWSITAFVDPVMSIMILVFILAVAGLFWAFAPRVKKS